jgi:hypothetical protein
MVSGTILVTGAIIALASRVSAHASATSSSKETFTLALTYLSGMFHPSMWGFNKTDVNRPQDPLIDLPFSEWWFVSSA